MKKYLTSKFSLIVITVTLAMALVVISKPSYALKTKQLAPDFTLPSNTGNNLRLKDYRGKIVMINFWATWCAPCRKELPHLNTIYTKYKNKGFVLLGVNIDNESKLAKTMAKELKVTFPILFDNTQKISEAYDIQAMPSTFIIDKSGKVQYIHYGYKQGYEKKYEKDVKKMLGL